MPRPKIAIPLEKVRAHKIFLATPMYGGKCDGPFTKAVIDLNLLCQKYGIAVEVHFMFNESLITRARCYLADEFIRSTCTHLLFIDSDISFLPIDVLAMLALDKDIIGAPYPKKTIAWEKIYDAAKLGLVDDNPMHLDQYVGDYVFNVVPGTKEIKLDEPVRVLETGTGFLLIKKAVFTKFQESYPELMFKPDHNRTLEFDGSREICAFFDTVIDPKTKRYLSEDYMFCQWARNIGFDVWLCPWMRLQHTGSFVFNGSIDALAALSQKQKEAGKSTPVMKNVNQKMADVLKAQAETPAVPVVEPVTSGPGDGLIDACARQQEGIDAQTQEAQVQ